MMYFIIVSKTPVFVSPQVNEKPAFSKISTIETFFWKPAAKTKKKVSGFQIIQIHVIGVDWT